MGNIHQIPVQWTGWSGAPAYSNFYVRAAPTTTVLDYVYGFFNASKSLFNNGITWTVPSAGNVLDEVTGDIQGIWTALPTTATVSGGAGASVYAAPAGYCVAWRSATFISGRRVIGKTFMVPIAASCFATDGTLDNTFRATALTAAGNLVTNLGAQMLVWHRPTGGIGGTACGVAAAAISDRAAILKSRR